LSRIRIIFLFIPLHFEGRYAIVTYRGAGCGGCKRRSMRNVKSISHDGGAGRRRPKSRGPGVAMLTSKGTGGSVAHAVEVSHGPERWHSSPPGRARDKPFQPLRAERRTKRRDRGDSTRVLFHFCTRGCGCVQRIRRSARPQSGRRNCKCVTASPRRKQQGGCRMTPKSVKRFSDQVMRRLECVHLLFTSSPRKRGSITTERHDEGEWPNHPDST